jgi:hypothetical protein
MKWIVRGLLGMATEIGVAVLYLAILAAVAVVLGRVL